MTAKTKTMLIAGSVVIAAGATLLTFNTMDTARHEETPEQADTVDTLARDQSTADANPARTETVGESGDNSELTQSQIESTLREIRQRQGQEQADSAMSDLGELMARYDKMTHTEKRDLLTAYATHFLRNAQYEDARYFYEQILQLPGLEQTNRLTVLQMLARIAMAAEDWEGFMAYNDQYFDAGGGYNWVVTGHMIRAFSQLENFDAAGEAFLLHFETGLHPEYDGSTEQYQRLYGNNDSIPLTMSDKTSALLLAQKMTEQFNQPENWWVLSEIYNQTGDVSNYQRILATARDRGFVDSAGNWNYESDR